MRKAMSLHLKCRNNKYPNSEIDRFPVPDDKVPWNIAWPNYNPIEFTSKKILKNPPYSDPPNDQRKTSIKWNKTDGKINRQSYDGEYSIQSDCPLNISGRTGLRGRGNLGRWGPNHAADTVLTRWNIVHPGKSPHQTTNSNKVEDVSENITLLDLMAQIDKQNAIYPKKGSKATIPTSPLFVLQFLAIERRDNGQWAFPGGMVNADESADRDTAPREFAEEVLGLTPGPSSPEVCADAGGEGGDLLKVLKTLYSKYGSVVYRGYVDDPRNTDNAWMETTAVNVHLTGKELKDGNDYSLFAKYPLRAGDDAKALRWIEIGPPWNSAHQLDNLYASHIDVVKAVAQKHSIPVPSHL